MSKSTNTVVYFDCKTGNYIYACGKCMLPNGEISHIHRRMCEWDYIIDKSLVCLQSERWGTCGNLSFIFVIAYVSEPFNKGWEGWNPINRFNCATILCLSQSKIWISNVIYRGTFCVEWYIMSQNAITKSY